MKFHELTLESKLGIKSAVIFDSVIGRLSNKSDSIRKLDKIIT
jgi:hypothetical protein